MTEFSECNSISLKSYASFPDFFSRASMKIIELGSRRKWAWFFNCNTQQIFYYNAPGISWVVFFFITSLSLHPNLTAEYDGWQGTGEIGMIHMIALSLHQIWAVWELFWMKKLRYHANWFHVQTMSVVSPSSTPNLASWILSWLAVRSTLTSSHV